MKRNLLLLSMGIMLFLKANAAYVPLTITAGFTADVVANGVGTGVNTTTNDVDAVNCLVSNGWQQTATSAICTTGIPATGLINSAVAATPGLSFQMGSYSANNDLRITTNNVASTLTFQTPVAAQTLFLLGFSTNGSSTITLQINFTDATNQTFTSQTISEWYGTTNITLTGFQRLDRANNTLNNNTSGPTIHQFSFAINATNQTKLISSIQITKTAGTTAGTILNIFAASIQTPACAAPTAPTATSITSTTASLNWTQTGTPAQWQIKYGAPGFNVNTAGTSIFTPTKPYTLNPPLTALTSYDYYVRAICSPGDTSAWSPVTNFMTLCNAPAIVSKKDSFRCGTGTVILEAATTAGASIKWYAAAVGGTALATSNTFTTPSIAITTNYFITAIQGTCESSPRQMVTATIRPIPTVNIGHDTTICPGVSYTFNAGNAGGAYLWSTGETTQAITKNAVGQYSVKVTVNQCSNSDTIIITQGIAPVNNLSDSVNLCDGSTTTLNAGNTGSTFTWTPGGATTQTIDVNSGGTRSVVIKSIHGCKITSSTFIKMRPLPVDNLGNDTAVCSTVSLLLNAGNAGYSYVWNAGATSQTINSSDSGTYTVTVTSPYNCVNVDDIHITYLPEPRTEGFNFIPKFFEELGKISFSPLDATNVNSFEWDFGDGSPLVTVMNPTHVYTASGEYEVTLKVYNQCADYTVKQTIHVDLPTGIVTLDNKDVHLLIYPNPAKSIVNISNKNPDYAMEDIMVFNAVGSMIYHQKADSKSMHQLSVKSFSTGVYFVRVLTNKGFVNKQIQITQ